MANASWGELATTTLERRRKQTADNVTNHNALLRHLEMRGNVQRESGGRVLLEELEYAENGNFKFYDGYETIDISPSDVLTSAEYSWKQGAAAVTCSGREIRINSGQDQMIRLVAKRVANAEKTMKNNISTSVYSDGTGSGGLEIGGLASLIATDPTTGTVGGINRANYAYWRNQKYDVDNDGGAAASATNIQGYMDALWLLQVRGADSPQVIIADSNYFHFYWQSLQSIQRITRVDEGAAGFRSLEFNGPGGSAPVFYDDACTTNRMFMLNLDYLFWRVHRDAEYMPLDDVRSTNQDAVVKLMILQANLTCSNASLQGVMFDD